MNRELQADLRWLADSIDASDGQWFLDAAVWTIANADALFVTDACSTGLGIWMPNTLVGFKHTFPAPSRDIYWMELRAAALAVAMGIESGARQIFLCTTCSSPTLRCSLYGPSSGYSSG